LRDQESRHELPALPIVIDYRAGRANGSWLPAFPLPGLRATVQRADRHGLEPGPGSDRHRVPGRLLEAALACCTDIVEANQALKMRTIRIQGMNPVNSFTFLSNKTATQSHSQANMLFWLDFLCDNLVYPCNTPPFWRGKAASWRRITEAVTRPLRMDTAIRRMSSQWTRISPTLIRPAISGSSEG